MNRIVDFKTFENLFLFSMSSRPNADGSRDTDFLVTGKMCELEIGIAYKVYKHPEIMDMLTNAIAIARELNKIEKNKN